MIRFVKQEDYQSWLEIAQEVEPWFGPLLDSPEFHEGIKECIKNKNGYAVLDKNGCLAGTMVIDKEKNEIVWLAVREKCRGRGYGDLLVKKAIDELDSSKDITVRTFAANISAGKGARAVYAKNGFSDFKPAGKNPAGIETVIMIRTI